MSNYLNGAGFSPELEDVWPYEDSYTKRQKFISKLVEYKLKRDALRDQVLSEVIENYDEK